MTETARPAGIKGRSRWIDIMRALTIWIVILGHMKVILPGVLVRWIYAFHMPAFFMLSGLTWKEPERISVRGYLGRMARTA